MNMKQRPHLLSVSIKWRYLIWLPVTYMTDLSVIVNLKSFSWTIYSLHQVSSQHPVYFFSMWSLSDALGICESLAESLRGQQSLENITGCCRVGRRGLALSPLLNSSASIKPLHRPESSTYSLFETVFYA